MGKPSPCYQTTWWAVRQDNFYYISSYWREQGGLGVPLGVLDEILSMLGGARGVPGVYLGALGATLGGT